MVRVRVRVRVRIRIRVRIRVRVRGVFLSYSAIFSPVTHTSADCLLNIRVYIQQLCIGLWQIMK